MNGWSTVVETARADVAAIRAGGEGNARALALLEGRADPRTESAEVHGGASALLLGRARAALLPAWLAIGGPGFAIACATWERRVIATHAKVGATIDLRRRWLEPRTGGRVAVALDTATWDALHAVFRKSTKSDRAAAQNAARAARRGAPPGVALWTSSVALLGAEAAADLRAVAELPAEERDPLRTWTLAALHALAAEPGAATQEAAIEMLEGAPPGALAWIARRPKDVVKLLGAAGAYALVDVLVTAHASTVVDATAARRVAEALAAIVGGAAPEVAAFFRSNLDSRLVGTVAAAWVAENEHDARASTLHASALAEKEVRSKRAKKVAKAAGVRHKRAGAAAETPEAHTDEVPWLLRTAPWRDADAVPPLRCVERRVETSFEEALHLSATDREGIDATTAIDDDDAVGKLAQSGLAVVPELLAMPIDAAIAGLRHVESPRVAARMLDAMATRRALVARAYFRAYPYASALALVDVALDDGAPARRRRHALEVLARLCDDGFADDVARACESDAASAAILHAARLVDYRDAVAVPPWARDAKLPPILVRSGARLPATASRHLLELCTLGGSAVLRDVASALDPVTTDAFLVALLDASVRAKAVGDESGWVLSAVASLGGPDAMRALAKRATEWNRERSTRDLVSSAIAALGEGGPSAALPLTELVRRGGALGDRANEVLAKMARREGLSTDELADMSVPTLDLDARGRAVLDFGTRTFDVMLASDLTPVVIDAEGRVVATALRVVAADDPQKARASLERLRTLKKTMREVARNVAARLEAAMVNGRSWRASRFATTIVAHPILGRLGRGLVWARGDGTTFRITEDGSYADETDGPTAIVDAETIRLPHVLDVAEPTQRAWAAILADYEIIQPFPQLGRATFTPTAKEVAAAALSRFMGAPAKQMAIQGRLLGRGWERVAEGGFTSAYVRRFKSVTATYTLVDPFGFGDDVVNDTHVGQVTFGVPLDRVPRLVFSEVAYDLHVLHGA